MPQAFLGHPFDKTRADAQDIGDSILFEIVDSIGNVLDEACTARDARVRFASILSDNTENKRYQYYYAWIRKIDPHLKDLDEGSDEVFYTSMLAIQNTVRSMILDYPH